MLAIGTAPGDSAGWPIALAHPSELGQSLGVVWLRDRGLGTSATTHQNFRYNGRKLGHLLDPRTGWPVECTASASVLAPSAAEADAMSTALFIGGLNWAETFSRLFAHLGAVILGAVSPTISTFNLTAEEYRPPAVIPVHSDSQYDSPADP